MKMNQSTFRSGQYTENNWEDSFELIEVQTDSYLGADHIVRIEDDYRRLRIDLLSDLSEMRRVSGISRGMLLGWRAHRFV